MVAVVDWKPGVGVRTSGRRKDEDNVSASTSEGEARSKKDVVGWMGAWGRARSTLSHTCVPARIFGPLQRAPETHPRGL